MTKTVERVREIINSPPTDCMGKCKHGRDETSAYCLGLRCGTYTHKKLEEIRKINRKDVLGLNIPEMQSCP